MAELELITGDRIIPFPGDRFTIGSASDCEVRVQQAGVQPHHAEILREADGTWWVRDISGSGTVCVDGYATFDGQLEGGSFLSIGGTDFSVRLIGQTGAGTVQSPALQRPDIVTTEDGAPAVSRTHSRRQQAPGQAPPGLAPRKSRAGPLEPGQIIENRYRITARLAAGGMGEVYKAEHIELTKPVALKVMLPDLSGDQDFVQRFKREAVAASQIGQQNIVDISDFGRTQDGRFYFVMELLDGRTLSAHLREGAFSPMRAIRVGVQIAGALAAAHDKGIVHRDLKPENVMLLQRRGQTDFVKVLDFGIAQVRPTGQDPGGLTQIGTVVGTPQYMSPEQAAGLPVDPRTDIYSLGLILYELVAGHPAFRAETPSQLMALQMTAMPEPLQSGTGESPLPQDLEELVSQMLAKKAHERLASMHDVVDRLEHLAATVATPPPSGKMRALDSGSQRNLKPLGQSRIEPLNATPAPRGGTEQDQPAVSRTAAFQGASSPPSPTGSRLPTEQDQKRVSRSWKTNAAPPSGKQPAPTLEDVRALRAPPETAGHPRRATEEDVPVSGEHDATSLDAPKKKSALPFVALGTVVLLAIGGFVVKNALEPKAPVVIAVPLDPEPEKKPVEPVEKKAADPVPTAAEKVTLTIESKPDNADVYEGDVLLGTTPLKLTRDKATLLAVRLVLAGHRPAERKIRFEQSDVLTVPLTPLPKPKKQQLHDDPYSNVNDLKNLPD